MVEPGTGLINPWGVVEVEVTAFNDTPGRYSDKLECRFTGELIPSVCARVRELACAPGAM